LERTGDILISISLHLRSAHTWSSLILFVLYLRNVDKELELVWRSAAADNKRMKDTVRQKGGMFDSDSDPNAHLSSEEGEAA